MQEFPALLSDFGSGLVHRDVYAEDDGGDGGNRPNQG